MSVQQIDDRLRGPRAGADSEPAETLEVDPLLRKRRDFRQDSESLRAGDAEYLQRLSSPYRSALSMFQPDLVLYVSGADPV